jgi:PIN domain nuclease of toxin-antitoxin system
VLALLFGEEGGERVAPRVPEALISAVNVAEVAGKLLDRGIAEGGVICVLSQMRYEVASFDGELIMLTAFLRPRTRALGLSLGDRACLALGLFHRLPVVTAERAWAKLDLGIAVEVIR